MGPAVHALGLSLVLFAIGSLAVLLRRDVAARLIGLAVMGQAAALAFAAFDLLPGALSVAEAAQESAAAPQSGSGQVFAFFAFALLAAELAIGWALVVAALRRAAAGERASMARSRS